MPLPVFFRPKTGASQKTSQKILEAISKNNEVSIRELASMVGISDRAVKYQLEDMKKKRQLKRIGADKGGSWKVTVKEAAAGKKATWKR